jgi:tetratricopeptide (TPR) repeat protein
VEKPAGLGSSSPVGISEKSPQELLTLLSNDPEAAWREARQMLSQDPEGKEMRFIAAKIAAERKDFVTAINLLAPLNHDTDPAIQIPALGNSADWMVREGRLREAARLYRSIYAQRPNFIPVVRKLAELSCTLHERQASGEYFLRLLQLGDFRLRDLFALLDRMEPFGELEQIDLQPEQASLSLLKAALAYAEGEIDRTHEHLARLSPEDWEQPHVQAFALRVCATDPRETSLPVAVAIDPTRLYEMPDFWFSSGVLFARQERFEEALGSLLKAFTLEPSGREVARKLVEHVGWVGTSAQAESAAQWLQKLDETYQLAVTLTEKEDPAKMWQIGAAYAELGRGWEGFAWKALSLAHDGLTDEERKQLENMKQLVVQPSSEEILQLAIPDLDQLPSRLPSEKDLQALVARFATSTSKVKRSRPPDPPQSTIVMEDVAAEVGIAVQYVFDRNHSGPSNRIHHATGGGLGILDFDLNGAPDIYVTQSGGVPVDPEGSLPNHLFRSDLHGHFQDVASSAGVADRGFGQGCAVGDINQDGLPDLLVANFGPKRIFINQGDGTFVALRCPELEDDETWTTSVAIADLSGDGCPELIAVNYIADRNVLTKKCFQKGIERSCAPREFRSAADQVYLNDGMLGFRKWDVLRLPESETGDGLAIVVTDWDQRGVNDFFVANDGKPNHYWIGSRDKEGTKFEEVAGLRGCAVGDRGAAFACMGIATGDFDRNQQLDMFVGNYFEEPANLYMQASSGSFVDGAIKYGLHGLTFQPLTFGAQALDVNQDGYDDIAVLNGHVEDVRFLDRPFEMAPQLFIGGPNGFQQQVFTSLDSYWNRKTLGRSLAKFDYLQDGRMDLVALHLDQPIALLRNQTPYENWLMIELVGTKSERDATGAHVVVHTDRNRRYQTVTAGDGYFCSNEKALMFGVDNLETVGRVVIRWPSGIEQTLSSPPGGCRLLVLEGRNEWIRRE